MSTYRFVIAMLLLTTVVGIDSAWAQTGPGPRGARPCFSPSDNVIDPTLCRNGGLSSIPFDILPPGARSLALGGAFAAVADDATAAEANPAGMTILNRPEVSIHGRRAEYTTPIFDVDALDGAIFGAAGPGPISGYDDSNTRPSFASVVYPLGRFVVSAYYHNAGKLQADSTIVSVNSVFIDTFVAANVIDVEQESYGLSGAFRVNDMLSVGASIKRTKLDINYTTLSGILDFSDVEFQFANPNAAALQIDEVDAIRSVVTGDDSTITWNAGLLLNPNGKVSAGLVYKEGGKFDVRSAVDYINVFNCNGLAGCNIPTANQVINLSNLGRRIELPDILSLGIAVRPSDTVLLSLQFDRVDYGQLPPPVRNSLLFNVLARTDDVGAEINVHAGAEKTFLFDQPIAGMSLLSVRAGVFSDRDRDGYPQLATNERHYTFGIGTVFGEDFQIDVASEWSRKIDNVVLSGVYRF
jgi:long-chain fatty acid transport protein